MKAGTVYFLVALGAGFTLEYIRLELIALHFSHRLAGILEIPTVLLATMIGARWAIDRLTLPPLPGVRLRVGFVALGLALVAQFMVVLPIRGLSYTEYLASQDPTSISASIGTLGVLLVMPFLTAYRWDAR
ncbi:MAG: hypothetical protein HP491_01365 [Nitrospira sp.]|nr:hypothetical protein [Nitrospira sp.]MBH0180643.1 hypothetical protein [Nitrospira sp.]MBH0185433.1 hypothetical protein [Nitrospira sp.]MBH0188042.1 hypothetical protein [Nitrospira sp.]